MDTLAQQLTSLILSVGEVTNLKDIRILIATWHHLRELTEWQTEVLCLLRQLSARRYTQIRARSLDRKLRASLQELDLASRLRKHSVTCVPNVFDGFSDTTGSGMDWEWEGGVVI